VRIEEPGLFCKLCWLEPGSSQFDLAGVFDHQMKW